MLRARPPIDNLAAWKAEGGNGYIAPLPHTHVITPVEGKAATEDEAGYEGYFVCEGCNTYFEDEAGETPIDDLAAWKAEGGNGYIAPIEPTVEKLLGDANDDGLVNMKDVLTIRKVLAGIEVTSYNAVNADCNEDGEVNTKDVLMLRKYLASMVEKLGA